MAIKPISAIAPNSLSFPAHTFAKLAPSPFLHANLSAGNHPTRPSGRTPYQARSPTCTISSLSHTNGSAVVRLGDTAVVCGIQAEILRVSDVAGYRPREATARNGDERQEAEQKKKEDTDEIAQLNLLVPNLELATGCSPANLPGGPPSPLAQALSQRILTLLHTSHLLSIDDLRIWHNPSIISTDLDVMDMSSEPTEGDSKPELKAFWTLYIDILFISLDGSPFDAAWLAIMAALKDIRLPHAFWDSDLNTVLCDPDMSLSRQMNLNGVPVPLSFGFFEQDGGKWVLVDMDGFEEGVCKEEGIVVVRERDGEMEVLRIEKKGGSGIGMAEIRQMVELAGERSNEWMRVLDRLKG